jgi:hypothetical protein
VIVATMSVYNALHDGTPWLLLACLVIFAGIVIGLYTETGSGISHHPYSKPERGGELVPDPSSDSITRGPARHRGR